MAEHTNKLTIYLVKEGITDIDEIVPGGHKRLDIEGVGSFFGADSFTRPPDWVSDFFGTTLGGHFDLRTSTARGLLIAPVHYNGTERIFALSFGHGRHLLAQGVVEERFGMKVVLNSVAGGSLRSIEKTALGAVPKQSREQIGREVEASAFGIDIEQDLLSAVTGRSGDARLGKTISGRDALALSVKIDLTEISDFLPVCLEHFESENYKARGFDWVDQIKDVRDPARLEELNNWLVNRLNARELDKIWMAPPTIVDWVDIRGFRYGGKRRPAIMTDLEPSEFLDSFGGDAVTLDAVKQKSVHAISAQTDNVSESWSAYRCIYAEATIGERVFVLNSGKWYEVAAAFAKGVIDEFDAMPTSSLAVPPYRHAGESEYNEALKEAIPGSHCLDANLIPYGGGHSSIEFCDVLTADRRLVHVKRYSGSAQLSHLFNQGVVSGELFASAPDFREKLNDKLPNDLKLPNPADRPNTSEYEVIFGIVMPPGRSLDIPFFSKVSLRNAKRRLRGYGYSVTKKHIESAPET